LIVTFISIFFFIYQQLYFTENINTKRHCWTCASSVGEKGKTKNRLFSHKTYMNSLLFNFIIYVLTFIW